MNSAVSVIYVNFNTSQLLLQSIRSLINVCRVVPFEILIVDNASAAEEKQQLQDGVSKLKVENIRILESDANLGFGAANNLAAKQSTAPFLFFLNPDTIIVNDVLTIFSDFLAQAPSNIGACGAKLLKPDLTTNDSYGNFPGIRQELAMTGLGFRFLMNNYRQNVAIAHAAPIRRSTVPYIVGADIFIRREVFELLKGFDENYFLYYEETDLFRKMKAKAIQAYILPEAEIIHLEGAAVGQATDNQFNITKFRFLLRSKLYYHSKWQPAWKSAMIRIIVLVQIFIQFAKGNMGTRLAPLLRAYIGSRPPALPKP